MNSARPNTTSYMERTVRKHQMYRPAYIPRHEDIVRAAPAMTSTIAGLWASVCSTINGSSMSCDVMKANKAKTVGAKSTCKLLRHGTQTPMATSEGIQQDRVQQLTQV